MSSIIEVINIELNKILQKTHKAKTTKPKVLRYYTKKGNSPTIEELTINWWSNYDHCGNTIKIQRIMTITQNTIIWVITKATTRVLTEEISQQLEGRLNWEDPELLEKLELIFST